MMSVFGGGRVAFGNLFGPRSFGAGHPPGKQKILLSPGRGQQQIRTGPALKPGSAPPLPIPSLGLGTASTSSAVAHPKLVNRSGMGQAAEGAAHLIQAGLLARGLDWVDGPIKALKKLV